MIKKKCNYNAGFTYVELIVVLSIFSVMTSIVLFNYNNFQENVDIKVLANDIASEIVQAQKTAISGQWNLNAPAGWKPSYGIYFDLTSSSGSNKNFIYFADLDPSADYINNGLFCPSPECLDKILITKSEYISDITVFYLDNSFTSLSKSNLSITFTRPNSGAVIKSATSLNPDIDYIQITISSPSLITSCIDVYPSGRIQINQCPSPT